MGADELTFSVLGPLEVRRGGAAVVLRSHRQRAVLAALLVQPGRVVGADALIDAAWGDALPENARAALQTVVSRLRAALGPEVILSDPAGYRLAAGPDALDSSRFERLRAEALGAPADRALGHLEAALRLWRGPAYDGLADADAIRPEAVRLDALRLVAVEDHAELCLEVGDVDAAATALESFVAAHPLRERPLRQLVTALYRADRVPEALDHCARYRRMLADELGLDPSPALRELETRVLRQDVAAGALARRGTSTAVSARRLTADGDLLGREEELADLLEAVGLHRLVTVTGVGGVGKSRLVAESLAQLTARLDLPVTVVELAGVADEGVVTAVSSALGVTPPVAAVDRAVLDYLSVHPAVLVLDACEHVLAGAAAFAGAVLRHCPRVRVVATSRRRLGLVPEQVLLLGPLAVPADDAVPDDARLTASMRLLVDRARRVRPSFALTPGTTAAAGEVCRRLDGLPLALELAATRAATLGVEALRERLGQGLGLLDATDTRPGGRSLRELLDWSYGLLGDAEKSLFAALAVFDGVFDLAGAEHVGGPFTAGPVAVALAGLVDASLVAASEDDAGVRYRQLDVVRAFARERLVERHDEPAVRHAHARWAAFLLAAAARAVEGPAGTATFDALDTYRPSFRAAADWATRSGEPRLAAEIAAGLVLAAPHRQLPHDLADVVLRVSRDHDVLGSDAGPLAAAAGAFVAASQGDVEDARRAARSVLPRLRGVDERFLALSALGIAALYRGRYHDTRRWCHELLAVDGLAPARQVDAHASLALVACYRGELAEARERARLATAIATAAGSPAHRAFARYAEAEVAAAVSPAAAVPLLIEVEREADEVGAHFAGGLAATALAAALTRLHRSAEVLAVVEPLLDRWLRLATWPQLWTTVRLLARLAAERGRPEDAALLLAAADHAPSATALTGDDAGQHARLRDELRERLGEEVHGRITTLGAMLPRVEVVDRARALASSLGRV